MSKTNFFQSCKVIFNITFRQNMKSKKTIFILIAVFLPVLLAVAYRLASHDVSSHRPFSRAGTMTPEQAFSVIMFFFLQFLAALVALFYGAALIADERDNKTIIYLFTRPIRKASIIVGKFAAYILSVIVILVPAMFIAFLIIVTDSEMSTSFGSNLALFLQRMGVNLLGVIVYGAIFTFFGVWRKHPVILGLMLAFDPV